MFTVESRPIFFVDKSESVQIGFFIARLRNGYLGSFSLWLSCVLSSMKVSCFDKFTENHLFLVTSWEFSDFKCIFRVIYFYLIDENGKNFSLDPYSS